MRALIIAAGEGKRLGHLHSPKPLTPLLGRPIIERVILTAKSAGVTDFTVVVGFKGDAIRNALGDGKRLGVRIDYVVNEDWRYGNGTSVYSARDAFSDEAFVLLMADHLFDPVILAELIEKEEGKRCVLCVDFNLEIHSASLRDDTKVLVEDGMVKEIGKDLSRFNGIDTGIFLMTRHIFDALEESIGKGKYSLTDGNRLLAARGLLHARDIGDRFWVDIDDIDSFRRAESALQNELIPGY